MFPLRLIFPLLALLALPAPLYADPTVIKTQSGPLVIDPNQQLMLDAAQKVLKHDYVSALESYNRVIAADGANIQAYLQRSVVKREMKDARGSTADAAMAVRLSEAGLRQNPKNARLYYQRGTGFRLLKDFPKAVENIRYAIQLTGNKRQSWEADLRAIALEEKMAQ